MRDNAAVCVCASPLAYFNLKDVCGCCFHMYRGYGNLQSFGLCSYVKFS